MGAPQGAGITIFLVHGRGQLAELSPVLGGGVRIGRALWTCSQHRNYHPTIVIAALDAAIHAMIAQHQRRRSLAATAMAWIAGSRPAMTEGGRFCDWCRRWPTRRTQ